MDLVKFKMLLTCPKCLGAMRDFKYKPLKHATYAGAMQVTKSNPIEHILVTCDTCGYSVEMETADGVAP